MQKWCFSRLMLRCFGPKKKSLSLLFGCKTHWTVTKCVCSSSRSVLMQMAPSKERLEGKAGGWWVINGG